MRYCGVIQLYSLSRRYNLDIDELELLQSVRLQLMRLESDGYKWKHPFTQCIVQTLLHNLRYGYIALLKLGITSHNKLKFVDEDLYVHNTNTRIFHSQ